MAARVSAQSINRLDDADGEAIGRKVSQTMKTVEIAQKFSLLRARVESELPGPAVITVTSAKRGDGKSLLSFGLARSLCDAGFSVLLVNANPSSRRVFAGVEAPRLSSDPVFDISRYIVREEGLPDTLSLASDGVASTTSAASVALTFAELRERYDYTIVCLPELVESSAAVSFARSADAVLLALRLGRQPLEADRKVAAALASSDVPTLGVVTLTDVLIHEFSKKQRALFVTEGTTLPVDHQHVRNRTANLPVS